MFHVRFSSRLQVITHGAFKSKAAQDGDEVGLIALLAWCRKPASQTITA